MVILMVFGIIFILFGLLMLGIKQYVFGILFIVFGLVLIINRKALVKKGAEDREKYLDEFNKAAEAVAKEKEDLANRFVKDFTFEPTGIMHQCDYSVGSRQDAIMKSKEGDPISIKEYEWKGEPALAFINDRTGKDLGVASAKDDLPAILKLMEDYEIHGEIKSKDLRPYKNDDIFVVRITLHCFNK